MAINGEMVTTLGKTVDPEHDTVLLDGRPVVGPQRLRYILMNKPAGVITSAVDGRGRRTVLDLVPSSDRIFPVGRLDLDTEGVLLLTNDGELAYRLAHPKFEVDKIYRAWVEGDVTAQDLDHLAEGVQLTGDVCVSGEAKVLSRQPGQTLVEIRLHEGKKRQIKRMMKAVGHPVIHLERTNFAGLTVPDLKSGTWRELTPDEVQQLYRLVGLDPDDKVTGGMG